VGPVRRAVIPAEKKKPAIFPRKEKDHRPVKRDNLRKGAPPRSLDDEVDLLLAFQAGHVIGDFKDYDVAAGG